MTANQNPRTRRGVWRVSRARAERLSIPAPLNELALESGIAAATLSLFERGLARLRPDQEVERRAALERLRERAAEAEAAAR